MSLSLQHDRLRCPYLLSHFLTRQVQVQSPLEDTKSPQLHAFAFSPTTIHSIQKSHIARSTQASTLAKATLIRSTIYILLSHVASHYHPQELPTSTYAKQTMPDNPYPQRGEHRLWSQYGSTPRHELPNNGRLLAPIRQPDAHGKVTLPGTQTRWFNDMGHASGVNWDTDHWHGGGQWDKYKSPNMGAGGWGWGPR